jgi:hypothetical protein
MHDVRVKGFLPSRCGFAFTNFFPPGPVVTLRLPGLALPVGDASKGLCGGMAFAVRDYFEAGRVPPRDLQPPPGDSRLFRYLVIRLWHSFNLPCGPLKYYIFQTLPDLDSPWRRGIRSRTMYDEWPRIRTDLEHGRLAPLGFNRGYSLNPLRLGDNHQVLAYGYTRETTGRVRLWIYDPNHGGRDDLTMTFRPDAPPEEATIEYSTGETVRGFFRTPFHRSLLPLPA